MQHVGPQASALQTAIIRAADLLRHVLRLARRLEQLAVLLRRHVPLRLHLQVPRLLEARALAGHALQQRFDALRHHRALQLEVEHQQRVQLVARQRRVVRRQVALELLRRAARLRQLLISEKVSPVLIFQILGMKIVIGMIAGFVIDLILHRKGKEESEMRIEHMCDHEHCHCDEQNIFKSALVHTLQIFAFIVVISFALNILIAIVGEDKLGSFMTSVPALGILLSGLIGLIPNCAASVVITQLYLEGLLTMGSMMAGLLVGSGIGLLVLFRVNEDMKENLKITTMLYVIGIACGFLIDLIL